MPEYTDKEVIELKLGEIHDDVKELKVRVGVQNGRVAKLEGRNNFLTGGLSVICVLVLPILFLVLNKSFDSSKQYQAQFQSLSSKVDQLIPKEPENKEDVQKRLIDLEAETKKLRASLQEIK